MVQILRAFIHQVYSLLQNLVRLLRSASPSAKTYVTQGYALIDYVKSRLAQAKSHPVQHHDKLCAIWVCKFGRVPAGNASQTHINWNDDPQVFQKWQKSRQGKEKPNCWEVPSGLEVNHTAWRGSDRRKNSSGYEHGDCDQNHSKNRKRPTGYCKGFEGGILPEEGIEENRKEEGGKLNSWLWRWKRKEITSDSYPKDY